MTKRVPKFLLFVNNSSHSYFVFKKPLHQKIERERKESYEQRVFISINSHSTLILGQQPTIDGHCCPCNT